MTESFSIVLDSQLGPRTGILSLEYHQQEVTGSLSILGFENPVTGEWLGRDRLRLSHSIRTRMNEFPCQSLLEVHQDRVTGTIWMDETRMRCYGEKLGRDPDGEKGEEV